MAEHPPAWLFSFVDLAFLLLIAMTQIGGDGGGISLQLGEIVVPRVRGPAPSDLAAGAAERWQLRIHPPAAAGTPFELSAPEAALPADRLRPEALRDRLVALQQDGEPKPLLAPHEDSRSQDLLQAVGVLEELWPSRRRATVARVFAGR